MNPFHKLMRHLFPCKHVWREWKVEQTDKNGQILSITPYTACIRCGKTKEKGETA